ncbi:MAG: hypothetical protein A2Y15_02815 [Clostridiales bacterium GWF2_36_10]|nr:MAG: hypothetical protein A2Y15_02815 [Clostridiales bacterium GWF2_36_10]HAN21117.1 hypothetical protein [Clostridiales bacterium]
MGTDYRLHFILFFASIVNGVFLGLVYDLFRISRMFFLKNRVVIFFEDLLFCLICSLSFILIFYNYSNGKMRAFAFLGGIGGFCAYYFTLGKFTKSVCERIYSIISPRFIKLKNIIKQYLYQKSKQIYTQKKGLSYANKARKGFGLLKTS